MFGISKSGIIFPDKNTEIFLYKSTKLSISTNQKARNPTIISTIILIMHVKINKINKYGKFGVVLKWFM